jgi:hypothetical protein
MFGNPEYTGGVNYNKIKPELHNHYIKTKVMKTWNK